MKIKIAGIINESVVDGPGIRRVIFTQGCPHHCPGCHNMEAQDPEGGYCEDTERIVKDFLASPMLTGVTLSGGEPLAQVGPCAEIASRVKEAGKDVIIYTGYTWEEIMKKKEKESDLERLLQYTDILVDGPFIEAQKDLNLSFRGSRNQRVIDVKRSLVSGTPQIILWGREAQK